MQSEDFENEEELLDCNCQLLLQTVQNLVNKYRTIICNESSSQFVDRHQENLSSGSTVCGSRGSPREQVAFKGFHSPEYVLSETSTKLSSKSHENSGQQFCADSMAMNLPCGSYSGVSGVSSIGDDFTTRDSFGQILHNAAFDVRHSELMKFMRIPNRMCPVHSRIDQHAAFSRGVCGLEFSYDTISTSNCWQGLNLAGASNSTTNPSCSKKNEQPSTSSLSNGSSLFLASPDDVVSCRTFFEPAYSFVAWTLLVVILGSIWYVLTRE